MHRVGSQRRGNLLRGTAFRQFTRAGFAIKRCLIDALSSLSELQFTGSSSGSVFIDLSSLDRHYWLVAVDFFRSFNRVRLRREMALRLHVDRLSQWLVGQRRRSTTFSDLLSFFALLHTILQVIMICLECRLIPLRQQKTIFEGLRSHIRFHLPLCLYARLCLLYGLQSLVDLLGVRLATARGDFRSFCFRGQLLVPLLELLNLSDQIVALSDRLLLALEQSLESVHHLRCLLVIVSGLLGKRVL